MAAEAEQEVGFKCELSAASDLQRLTSKRRLNSLRRSPIAFKVIERPAERCTEVKVTQNDGSAVGKHVHIERVLASECNSRERANSTADRILSVLDKIKLSR